jgi:hypothetical protein
MKGGARQGSGRKPIQIDERRAFSLFEQGFSKLEIANQVWCELQQLAYHLPQGG